MLVHPLIARIPKLRAWKSFTHSPQMTTSTRVLSKMLKPELLKTAEGLDKRLQAQEKATMTLFYLSATAIISAFVF